RTGEERKVLPITALVEELVAQLRTLAGVREPLYQTAVCRGRGRQQRGEHRAAVQIGKRVGADVQAGSALPFDARDEGVELVEVPAAERLRVINLERNSGAARDADRFVERLEQPIALRAQVNREHATRRDLARER